MRIGVLLRSQDLAGNPAREALSLTQSLGDNAETYILDAAVAVKERYPAAGTLYLGVSPDLQDPDPEQLYCAARRLLGDQPPDLLLIPEGALFESVGPRLAGGYGYSAVTDVGFLSLQDGRVLIGKGAFGGKAQITLVADGGVVLGVRKGTFPQSEMLEQKPELRDLGALLPGIRARKAMQDTAGDDLLSARVIISGGRGLGSRESYLALRELAELLGGVLGASRAAVDEGWARPAQQVGITGQKVAPELYLAIGISGASQHLSGMSGSATVIAINRDEKAPIFAAADLGVVVDWHAFWPHLRKALEG